VHVYVCVCAFYVADLKLLNGNAFSAAVLSVPARYFSVETNILHMGLLCHILSLFVCVMFHRE